MTDAQLANRFFNFPPETLELVRAYRREIDPGLVEPIFQAILTKYSADAATLPPRPGGIQNAFGLESLTLLEVILDLQDALGIILSDAELQELRSLEQAIALVSKKVNALRELPRPARPPAS